MTVPPPGTAQKRNDIDQLVRRLNNQYDLAIVLADPSLAPQALKDRIKTDEEHRVESILRRLRPLFFTQRDALDQTLAEFHTHAEEFFKRLAPRPYAEQHTLRRCFSPLRARSDTERLELQTRLLELLGKAYDAVFGTKTCETSSSKEVVRASQPCTTAAAPYSSKRFSNELPENPSAKRAKEHEFANSRPSLPSAVIENVSGVGTRSNPISLSRVVHNEIEIRPSLSLNKSSNPSSRDTSANSSRASFRSDIFSQSQNGGHQPDTQTTFGASSPVDLTDNSFPPCSKEPSVFGKSFSRHNPPTIGNPIASMVIDVGGRDASLKPIQANVVDCLPVAALPLIAMLTTLEERLDNVWPLMPTFLNHAPLAVAWEVTRISMHCGVKVEELNMTYDKSWDDQYKLRQALRCHPSFKGKTLPDTCRSDTWKASLTSFQSRDMVVSLSLDVQFSKKESGPLFDIVLQPLKLELGHRLTRRFGADRFLEVNFPSPTQKSLQPPIVRGDENGSDKIIRWLAEGNHFIVGRRWVPFFTRDSKKKVKYQGSTEAKVVPHERIYFFAEDGHSFTPPSNGNKLPRKEAATNLGERAKIQLPMLLEWAFQTRSNMSQPALKLFSRLALSLSRTHATVVLRDDQIRHQPSDILSPTGNVMNDRIGRMSNSLAKKIREHLGLIDTPSGFQGRIGSAKGFWIRDINDMSDEDWIETYPSQRKWNCDFADEDHRTFEVKMPARELKSASLNLQFIPVIENRAKDPRLMRTTIANLLLKSLADELERQRSAMEHPIQFRQWAHTNSSFRSQRIHGHVPFLGGLPESEEETLNFLLDAGFNPKEQKVLQDIAWNLQVRKCNTLKSKMNIKVGRSAYAYMVVDFLGVLEEGEVHLGFSSKFQDEEFSDTLLHGIDVLVARAPAHFVSDIQRVKAVFRPELRGLKDVVVFSTKGNVALAEKLSGGDYDGDQAWVCWDPDIVNNFQNADVPIQPDLFKTKYLRKETTKFLDFLRDARGNHNIATTDFIYRSLSFNMEPQFLGLCTSYKERLCYKNGTVNDEAAILLSTLVGHLVDQAKQGIVFTEDEWARLRKERLAEQFHLDQPAYTKDRFDGDIPSWHILDYLKFSVAKPTIDKALAAFHESIQAHGSAGFWDRDLVELYNDFEARCETSPALKMIHESLIDDIKQLEKQWKTSVVGNDNDKHDSLFTTKVRILFEQWVAIKPPLKARESKTAMIYLESYLPDTELSMWARLKASAAFKLCYYRSPRFVWRMAGRQLQWMKAMRSAKAAGDVGALAIAPHMYNILRPDSRIVAALAARREAAGYAESTVQEVDFDEKDMLLDDDWDSDSTLG